jgi:hypothetical protein
LYYFNASILVLLLTLMDIAHFTLYLTYWIPALLITNVCVVILMVHPTTPRTIFLGVLLVWIVILPYIRWDRTKSFFIDAHQVRVGMTEVQARETMKPYFEFRDRDMVSPYGERIAFKPNEGGGDSCVVYLKNDKVVRIEIRVD